LMVAGADVVRKKRYGQKETHLTTTGYFTV